MLEYVFEDVRAEGYTKNEIFNAIRKIHLGDKVLIPGKLVDHPFEKYVRATVWQVCSYHTAFLLEYGYLRSLTNVDCMDVIVEQPSGFRSYDYETSLKDVMKAMGDVK